MEFLTIILDARVLVGMEAHASSLSLYPSSSSRPPPRPPPRLPATSLVTSKPTYHPHQMNPPFINPNLGVRQRLLTPATDTIYPVVSFRPLSGAANASLTTPQPVTAAWSAAALGPLL